MKSDDKTKEQLLKEIDLLKAKIAGLEKSEIKHRRVEEALRESEAHYRQLFNLLPYGGEIINTEGKIIDCSMSTSRMLGYEMDEIIGKHITNFVDADSVKIFKQNFPKLLKGESFSLEGCMVHKNGSRIHILRAAQPIFNADKEVVAMLALNIDITERKQVEEALRESEERFRAQYNGSPTPSFTWRAIGEDFVLVDYNSEAIATINGQSYKFLGKTAKEMYQNRHEIIDDLHRCLTEKTIIKSELMSEHFMPGKYIITTYAFVPPDLVMVHITDITERKQMEEQLKKSLKEKEILIKEIYHRVKNNLAVVSGLLNIQAAKIKDKKAKSAFQATRDRIFSLSAVHSQLYHSENYSNVDYKKYIKKLVSNIYYSFQMSGHVKLHLDLDDITMPIDKAIPCGLLLNELVTNALKYAFPENRKGNLWITTHSLEDKNCEIIVKDDGIGIPESFNIEKTETLGLKLIDMMAKQIEGALEIESKKGTEFRIRLSTEPGQVIR